jgi:hypothetical protein
VVITGTKYFFVGISVNTRFSFGNGRVKINATENNINAKLNEFR